MRGLISPACRQCIARDNRSGSTSGPVPRPGSSAFGVTPTCAGFQQSDGSLGEIVSVRVEGVLSLGSGGLKLVEFSGVVFLGVGGGRFGEPCAGYRAGGFGADVVAALGELGLLCDQGADLRPLDSRRASPCRAELLSRSGRHQRLTTASSDRAFAVTPG